MRGGAEALDGLGGAAVAGGATVLRDMHGRHGAAAGAMAGAPG
jgi:hypothetical protein